MGLVFEKHQSSFSPDNACPADEAHDALRWVIGSPMLLPLQREVVSPRATEGEYREGCYDELAALLMESSDCTNFMIEGAEVIVHRITKSTSWLSPSAKIVVVARG